MSRPICSACMAIRMPPRWRASSDDSVLPMSAASFQDARGGQLEASACLRRRRPTDLGGDCSSRRWQFAHRFGSAEDAGAVRATAFVSAVHRSCVVLGAVRLGAVRLGGARLEGAPVLIVLRADVLPAIVLRVTLLDAAIADVFVLAELSRREDHPRAHRRESNERARRHTGACRRMAASVERGRSSTRA